MPEESSPRRERKQVLCGICPAGCWVEAELEGGRLVGLEAQPGHPLGMICERARHASEIVDSPHRLKTPLRRRGPKGTYDFERLSWDAAYDLVVERLLRIKAESGPEAVAI